VTISNPEYSDTESRLTVHITLNPFFLKNILCSGMQSHKERA